MKRRRYQEYHFTHRGFKFTLVLWRTCLKAGIGSQQKTEGGFDLNEEDYDLWEYFDTAASKFDNRVITIGTDGQTNVPLGNGVKIQRIPNKKWKWEWDAKAYVETPQIRDYLDSMLRLTLEELRNNPPKCNKTELQEFLNKAKKALENT